MLSRSRTKLKIWWLKMLCRTWQFLTGTLQLCRPLLPLRKGSQGIVDRGKPEENNIGP